MQELNINYSGVSNIRKNTTIIIATYLIVFCAYFCLTEVFAGRFGMLMIASSVGLVLASVLILLSTTWTGSTRVEIDSLKIAVDISKVGTLNIEWIGVSEVNIGASYIVFQMNGGVKQKKLELSSLVYRDVVAVKSKIIELSEFKNIPYKND